MWQHYSFGKFSEYKKYVHNRLQPNKLRERYSVTRMPHASSQTKISRTLLEQNDSLWSLYRIFQSNSAKNSIKTPQSKEKSCMDQVHNSIHGQYGLNKVLSYFNMQYLTQYGPWVEKKNHHTISIIGIGKKPY